jgi:hypothetical protein
MMLGCLYTIVIFRTRKLLNALIRNLESNAVSAGIYVEKRTDFSVKFSSENILKILNLKHKWCPEPDSNRYSLSAEGF